MLALREHICLYWCCKNKTDISIHHCLALQPRPSTPAHIHADALDCLAFAAIMLRAEPALNQPH